MFPPQLSEYIVRVIRETLQTHRRKNEFRNDYFCVFGSYPAALRAWPELKIPYNDINVYIEATGDHDNPGQTIGVQEIWVERNLVPDSDVRIEFALVGQLNLSTFLDHADINCNRIGFVANFNPRLSIQWQEHPEYLEFLNDRRLAIVNFKTLRLPAGALIRLLFKAQQMGLEFTLPPIEDIISKTNGCRIGTKNHERYLSLQPQLRNILDDDFYLEKDVETSSYFFHYRPYRFVHKNEGSADFCPFFVYDLE